MSQEAPPYKIITVLNGKGGISKTTKSIGLAGALAHFGHRVLLADADISQKNLSKQWEPARRIWFPAEQDLIAVRTLDVTNPEGIVPEIEAVRPEYIVVDMPPNYHQSYDTFIAQSDLLIIPCIPGEPMNLNTTVDTLATIRRVLDEAKSGTKALIVVTAGAPRPDALSKAFTNELHKAAGRYCIPLYRNQIPYVGVERKSRIYKGATFSGPGNDGSNKLDAPFRDLAEYVVEILK